jgi:alkylhydroperoxidase family enzyme
MARLPYPDLSQVSDELRATLDTMPPLNIFRMLPHAETLVRGFLQLGGAILTQATLDARLRELAILRIAVRAPARYEWQQHVPIARACGATDAEIAALERGDVDGFGARERSLLAFTDELIDGPRASDATMTAMRTHFSDREVCEAILSIGFYMMVARFLETTGVELETANEGASVGVIARSRRG